MTAVLTSGKAGILTATDVLEAVRKRVPFLREQAVKGEERRWVTDESLTALQDAGVFRMAVPERFGGLDLSLADQADVLAEVGAADGSLVWVTSVYVAEAWVCQRFSERAQEEIFTGGFARVSGSITPSGVAVPVEGGYLLNGSWKWNTGCRGAQWDLMVARLDRSEQQTVLMMVVPTADLTIADDWFTSSATATGSSMVTAIDLFVPEHRVEPIPELMAGTTEGCRSMQERARNYPLLPFISAHSAAAFLGMARGGLELFLRRAEGRSVVYTPWTDQSQYPITQVDVGTAASMIAAAEGLARKSHEILQGHADAGDQPTLQESVAVHAHSAYEAELCRQAVDILYRESGASVIGNGVAMQRVRRDIEGLALHGAMYFKPKMEVLGRILLGLDTGGHLV